MNELSAKILRVATPEMKAAQVAAAAGCSVSEVYRCVAQHGLVIQQRKRPEPRSALRPRILELADGSRTSKEIADLLQCNRNHVQNVLRTLNRERLPRGARRGPLNPSYLEGRSIDLDGYALVSAPPGHPSARRTGVMLEHRLVMERELGRHLEPSEIVDHIDGLHLHNAPSNLRLFATNRDHLRATISGQRPLWSEEGWAKMRIPSHLRPAYPQIDTYRQRKASGEVRLLQILLAASRFGIASPFLLGTLRHLEQARIDCSSPTTIERALADLLNGSALARVPSGSQ